MYNGHPHSRYGFADVFSQWSAVADSLNQRNLIGMWIYKIAVVFLLFLKKNCLVGKEIVILLPKIKQYVTCLA